MVHLQKYVCHQFNKTGHPYDLNTVFYFRPLTSEAVMLISSYYNDVIRNSVPLISDFATALCHCMGMINVTSVEPESHNDF